MAALSLIAAAACTKNEFDSQNVHNNEGRTVLTVELPGETEANVVKPGYFLNEPWFEYNPEDKLYYRFQYGDKQIDELTGEQIAYKNIILQYSSWRKYDENGYLNIDVDEPNVGKYIVN